MPSGTASCTEKHRASCGGRRRNISPEKNRDPADVALGRRLMVFAAGVDGRPSAALQYQQSSQYQQSPQDPQP
jgi:hypothetical protein